MYRPSCNVAVVGCGLGGLAAAIGIKRAGHSVTVFEQAKALSEVVTFPHTCQVSSTKAFLIFRLERVSKFRLTAPASSKIGISLQRSRPAQ